MTYASIAGHILGKPTPSSPSRPLTPAPPIQNVQSVQPVVPMEASDLKQKRSRNEDSLEGSPPAEVQPSEPSCELVGADTAAAPAGTTCPRTQVVQRPEPCGNRVAGGDRPQPAPSTSRQRTVREKRSIGSTVGGAVGSRRAPAPSRGGPTPAARERPRVPVTCPTATTSSASAGKPPKGPSEAPFKVSRVHRPSVELQRSQS